ncbi:DUF1428 domain-containing protein [Paracoccus sp. (in: a-proteobacteria)]|uniref:DUF1428 domain-containing protein n=1 Tax=Paracoccus sp. TaxID=267 RepID=UPI00321FF978
MAYVSGFLLAVPTANRQKYLELAQTAWPMFRDMGALRLVEAWGDDVPHGKVTDFFMATKASADETVVFSWVEWPDRATAEAGFARMGAEQGAQPPEMPFDGMRMMWGGFVPILDEKA